MGRKTYESLPPKMRPLPRRRNVVLTSNPAYAVPGIEVYTNLELALMAAGGDCFVVGGERVFRDALPFASRVHLTAVDVDCEGDAFFPELGPRWTCVSRSAPLLENGWTFEFQVYE